MSLDSCCPSYSRILPPFIVLHCMSVTLLAFLHWQHHFILKLIEINGSSIGGGV